MSFVQAVSRPGLAGKISYRSSLERQLHSTRLRGGGDDACRGEPSGACRGDAFCSLLRGSRHSKLEQRRSKLELGLARSMELELVLARSMVLEQVLGLNRSRPVPRRNSQQRRHGQHACACGTDQPLHLQVPKQN